MVRERPSAVPGAVVWESSAPQWRTARVLPDGCMDLVWLGPAELLVAGPDTRAHLVGVRTGAEYTGLRLPPGLGRRVFGVPAHELRDLRVPLEQLWPTAEARRLAGRVAEATDRGAVLEAAAVGRLRATLAADGPGGDGQGGGRGGGAVREAERLRRLVLAGAGRRSSVPEIARAACLGERQLHRRCLDLFGYGASTLARVLRMRRAVRLARGGLALARVAAECGYADQSHLAREVRGLAGVPLTSLCRPEVARRDPPGSRPDP